MCLTGITFSNITCTLALESRCSHNFSALLLYCDEVKLAQACYPCAFYSWSPSALERRSDVSNWVDEKRPGRNIDKYHP